MLTFAWVVGEMMHRVVTTELICEGWVGIYYNCYYCNFNFVSEEKNFRGVIVTDLVTDK